ncbi:unnamed protein product [Meganyctiphanes norvegica]|uniref:C2H2-type domain-containing protein n=1 Tax=Meganyctiphanes norvegica TaxID=48144 RepID=A0AAV2SSV8_MEGNR
MSESFLTEEYAANVAQGCRFYNIADGNKNDEVKGSVSAYGILKVNIKEEIEVNVGSNNIQDVELGFKEKVELYEEPQTFEGESYVVKHELTKNGERSYHYQCNLCDKTFLNRHHLVKHLRMHTEDKPFQCSQCDKAFSYNSKLIEHQRIHSGEKPYQCSQCDKAFSRNSNLMYHLRIHTGDKPYQCSQCNKAFSQNSNLIKHLGMHTGDKPYQCSQCYKAF